MARFDFWPPGGRVYLVTGAQNRGFGAKVASVLGVGDETWQDWFLAIAEVAL